VDTLLQVGLSNAVVATFLALLALAVGFLCRRPALVHSLWLLVLLKLITPPILSIPVPWPARTEPVPALADPSPTPVQVVSQPELPAFLLIDPLLEPDDEPAVGMEPAEPAISPPAVVPALATVAPDTPASESEPARPTALANVSWELMAAVLWLGSSGLWFALVALRTYRFHRLLRHALPAPPALAKQVQRLAERLGLARIPSVWLIPGRVSPMLWAVGSTPRLVLPAGLWERLDPEQRDTLLIHELAHLRRRDHWVRGVELVVTGLYWWHPIVWLARRELREAEEQCCDAWVVWTLPRAARAYATALVETVDFLSEARPALPLAASGIGQVHDLRRRLTMIMRGTTPRALTWTGLLVVLGLGAFLLPVLPTWAQDDPFGKRAKEEKAAKEAEERERAANQDKGRAEIKELMVHIERLREQLRDAEARLKKAQDRLADPGKGGDGKEKIIIEIRSADGQIRRIEVPPGSDILRRIEPPAGADVLRKYELRRAEDPTRMAPAPGAAPDRRIQDLEKKLDQLMKELENLRKELRPGRPGDRPGQGKGPAEDKDTIIKYLNEILKDGDRPRIIELQRSGGKEIELELKDLLKGLKPEEVEEILKRIKPDNDRRPNTPSPGGKPPRNAPAEDVEGKIKAVDPESGLVTISLGSDSGLSKGHTLEVFRLHKDPGQSKYLGTIEIIRVDAKEAVGRPVQRLFAPVEVGDRVASRVARATGAGQPPEERTAIEARLLEASRLLKQLEKEHAAQGQAYTEVKQIAADRLNVADARLRAAGQAIRAAEANVKAAQANRERLQELAKANAVSKAEVEAAEAQYQVSLASLEKARLEEQIASQEASALRQSVKKGTEPADETVRRAMQEMQKLQEEFARLQKELDEIKARKKP